MVVGLIPYPLGERQLPFLSRAFSTCAIGDRGNRSRQALRNRCLDIVFRTSEAGIANIHVFATGEARPASGPMLIRRQSRQAAPLHVNRVALAALA